MNNKISRYEFFMNKAIALARKGWGMTGDNPMVGCLVVEGDEILSKGYHKRSGSNHAEVNAINSLKKKVTDKTELYITLEPCCTHGRTGACTKTIINSKIKKVIIGTLDPNPIHKGKGVEILEKSKINVIKGILKNECFDLNILYNNWILNKKTFSALKIALTIDGSLATSNGNSKWITGKLARKDVMIWRRLFPSILVSSNTVIQDNPRLTSRIDGIEIAPIRFILDRELNTIDKYYKYNVYTDAFKSKTVIVHGNKIPSNLKNKLKEIGILAWEISEKNGSIDLAKFFIKCTQNNILGVFSEGGARLSSSMISSNHLDYIFIYQSNKILLDSASRRLGFKINSKSLDKSIKIKSIKRKSFGNDQLLRGYI